MNTNLSKYYRLPRHRRHLLIEATWQLLVARAAMALLPFRRIAPHLGTQMMEVDTALSEAQQQTATEVAWAIGTASRKLPLGAVCIHKAIGAKRMLATRNVPNTLYLGTRKNRHDRLDAHAWVVSGDIPITGTTDHHGFVIVSTFS